MNKNNQLDQANSHYSQKGMKMALISIVINMLLAAIKILTGILGHAYALIADGIESLMDIFSSTIVWGGLRIGAIPADRNHPYGHGKAEPLAAMFVSLTLIGVGVGIAVHSIGEIFVPHHAPEPYTLIVLVLVIIIKEILFRFSFALGEETNSLSLKADAWHSRSDALTSLAAFIGISIAVVFGKGYEPADDWAALFASAVILYNGSKIFKSAVSEIMDEAPSPETENDVRQISKTVEGVVDVEKCRIRKSGNGLFIEIHIEVQGDISVRDGHEIAHRVKDKLMASNLKVLDAVIHVEPKEMR